MIGNHPFLVGRNDKDFHAALPAGDAKGIGGIRIVIDRQSQPAEPFANTPEDLRVVLADPGGEDDTIKAAERCGERAEFSTETRSGGKEGGRTCRIRGWPVRDKKKNSKVRTK